MIVKIVGKGATDCTEETLDYTNALAECRYRKPQPDRDNCRPLARGWDRLSVHSVVHPVNLSRSERHDSNSAFAVSFGG